MHIWIFFLHFRSTISIGDVMALSTVVLLLGFAIGIRCLVLVLSRTQHPSRLNNFHVVPDASVPMGIHLQLGVDMDNFAVVFPVFARTYTCVSTRERAAARMHTQWVLQSHLYLCCAYSLIVVVVVVDGGVVVVVVVVVVVADAVVAVDVAVVVDDVAVLLVSPGTAT